MVKLAANLCCEIHQTNIKVAAENFFYDFQVGFKLSVSAIENDDEYRKQNFSNKPMTRVKWKQKCRCKKR